MPKAPKSDSLFARIENADDAAKMVRGAALAFFFLAALQGAMGLMMTPSLLTDAIALGVLAGILMKWRSRTAAVLLLVLTGLQAGVTILNRIGVMSVGGKNVILAAIMLIVAVRAVEATFKLHGRYRNQLVPTA